MGILYYIDIFKSLLNLISLFEFVILRLLTPTTQMKVNWMKPPALDMNQYEYMITYK